MIPEKKNIYLDVYMIYEFMTFCLKIMIGNCTLKCIQELRFFPFLYHKSLFPHYYICIYYVYMETVVFSHTLCCKCGIYNYVTCVSCVTVSMTQYFYFILYNELCHFSLHQWKATLSCEETPAAGAQVVCEALFAQRQSKSMFCSHICMNGGIVREWCHRRGVMS